MFDRFTDRARKTMGLARQEAQRLHHHYISTEHLLLGLIEEGTGVACTIFRNLNVSAEDIRAEIDKLVEPGPVMPTMGQLPFTPRMSRVLRVASEEAQKLDHNYIGTEHLLVGLFYEKDGIAADVLTNLGVTLGEREAPSVV